MNCPRCNGTAIDPEHSGVEYYGENIVRPVPEPCALCQFPGWQPGGCRWCGVEQRQHLQRWKTPPAGPGWHKWEPPTQQQIKQRMWSRRTARLNAAPAKYHATTGWAADHTGESGEPYCADCATDDCRPWQRIQARLDELRWGIPRRPGRSHQTANGWGGNHPTPF